MFFFETPKNAAIFMPNVKICELKNITCVILKK